MNELGGYASADLRGGMCATFAKTITEADIVLFAAVSGDNNAIHINEEFAAGTIFKGSIARLFSASKFSSPAKQACKVLRLALPALVSHAFFWIPAIVVASFVISAPLAWFIAPWMMMRFIRERSIQ